MKSYEFKHLFLKAVQEDFPKATVEIQEKRDIIFEARIGIDKKTFIEVYFNALTGKKSYALIRNGRIMGYDNYRFWHYHSPNNPKGHISCEEPEIKEVLKEMREVMSKF